MKASRRLQEGSAKPSGACHRGEFVETVRRLREPFVEVPCTTEGSTKTPWRVHEASSKGPWRNFVGFLHDDACNRVESILCFVGPELLAVLRNPFQCHEIFLSLYPLFPRKRFDIPLPFWVRAHHHHHHHHFRCCP